MQIKDSPESRGNCAQRGLPFKNQSIFLCRWLQAPTNTNAVSITQDLTRSSTYHGPIQLGSIGHICGQDTHLPYSLGSMIQDKPE